MDYDKFSLAVKRVFEQGEKSAAIGTFSEKSIHAVLKDYYASYSDNKEVNIGRFIADIVNPYKIIEIQTKSFYRLKKKLDLFLKINKVEIVYPIIIAKNINMIRKETGDIKIHRHYNWFGNKYQIFIELYSIKEYLNNEKLSFKLVLLEVVENRLITDNRRKQTLSLYPSSILEEISIEKLADYISFLPKALPDNFTTKDLKLYCKIPLKTAQIMANVLCFKQVISKIGEENSYYVYKRNFTI